MSLISLDVFDTAIFRGVYRPTDIFRVVEDEVGHNFHNLRIDAQNKARRISIHYNIFDIYKYIPQFNVKDEIKAEYANCRPNPYILNMYNKGKDDFIFISDMYLPEKVIKGMLERCGYKNPRVFVSCDYKACKGDGRLFKVVEQKIGRKIDKHIGDNYHCDILGAKRARIPEVEFVGPPIYDKAVITPELKSVKLRKLLIDKEFSNDDIAEKVGYWFAPLILAFTQKVLNDAKDSQTIFFNARDSFLMYIIARWILKTKKKIKYCRFSRKSCFLPNITVNKAINSQDNRESLTFFKIQRTKSIREFLKTYKLNENRDYSQVLKQFDITLDSIIDLHPRKQDIVEKTLIAAQQDLFKVVIRAKEGFKRYIRNLGMKDGDIWVDIGYTGTMQAMIKRIARVDLKGEYIGASRRPPVFQGVRFDREAFLPTNFIEPYNGAALELIFSEPAGTAVNYSEDGKPILLKDFKFRKEVTKRIARGVLKGVKDILKNDIKITKEDCMKVIQRYFDKPTLEEASFANQSIFENGSNEESVVWFDKEQIRKGKLQECYGRSYWKTAFRVLLENDPDFKSIKGVIIK